MLRSYIHPLADDWDQRLADAEFAYNSSTQRSTGRSPFYTAYGFHPRTPADLYNPQASESVPAAQVFLKSMLEGRAAARAALQQAQQQQKEYHDQEVEDASSDAFSEGGLGATGRSALQVPGWREAQAQAAVAWTIQDQEHGAQQRSDLVPAIEGRSAPHNQRLAP